MSLRLAFRRTLLLGGALALSTAASAQKIAFTWDDLPAHSTLPPGETRQQVIAKIIAAMKAEHMPPVYGFVNAVHTQTQPDTVQVLDAWRAAGLPLGNHSWSHMNLNTNTVEAFEDDVLKDEPILKQEMGAADWHWFRYPNLAEGNTPEKHAAIRAFLHEHGYKVAQVTMSFGDYLWNEPYARCSVQRNEEAIKQLEQSYLDAAVSSLDDSRKKSQALFGHDIPYVLLMHVGAFDARMLPRLLALYRAHGVSFVTLEEAEKDEFYRVDTDLTLSGPDTLEGAMAAKSLPPIRGERGTVNVNTLCREAPGAAK